MDNGFPSVSVGQRSLAERGSHNLREANQRFTGCDGFSPALPLCSAELTLTLRRVGFPD
jgi:hypothetical protein